MRDITLFTSVVVCVLVSVAYVQPAWEGDIYVHDHPCKGSFNCEPQRTDVMEYQRYTIMTAIIALAMRSLQLRKAFVALTFVTGGLLTLTAMSMYQLRTVLDITDRRISIAFFMYFIASSFILGNIFLSYIQYSRKVVFAKDF